MAMGVIEISERQTHYNRGIKDEREKWLAIVVVREDDSTIDWKIKKSELWHSLITRRYYDTRDEAVSDTLKAIEV